jgi:predicted GIY-YIG superfamily endonuclease
MSDAIGRSVRLFLVDGKSTGLITAEIMNWTGHVLTGPRTELPKFLARPEVGRTGVYLLHGRDPEDPDRTRLYIGESDQVGTRLKQHNQEDKKTYWERTCVITSKDQNITKAHARYLESRLIGIAAKAKRATLDNGTAPPLVPLPEADCSDMEFFIDQIRLILPVLGLDFLREAPQASALSATVQTDTPTSAPTGTLFTLDHKKTGLHAEAREIDGDFILLKGSRTVAQWKQESTKDQGYAKQFNKLIADGTLQPDANSDWLMLSEDVAFSSPSAAAAVVVGRSANGRIEWKVTGTQQTYAAWQDEQIAKAEQSATETTETTEPA